MKQQRKHGVILPLTMVSRRLEPPLFDRDSYWVSRPPKDKHVVEVLDLSLKLVDTSFQNCQLSRVARITKPATHVLDFCGSLVAQLERIVFERLAWPIQHGILGRYVIVDDNVGYDPTVHRRSQAFLKCDGRFVLVSAVLSTVKGALAMAESLLRPSWLVEPPNRYSILLCQPNKAQLQQIAYVCSGWLLVV